MWFLIYACSLESWYVHKEETRLVWTMTPPYCCASCSTCSKTSVHIQRNRAFWQQPFFSRNAWVNTRVWKDTRLPFHSGHNQFVSPLDRDSPVSLRCTKYNVAWIIFMNCTSVYKQFLVNMATIKGSVCTPRPVQAHTVNDGIAQLPTIGVLALLQEIQFSPILVRLRCSHVF